MKRLFAATMWMGLTVPLLAQERTVGYVPTGSAAITGAVVINGTKAGLTGSNVVKAMDQPAVVTLARGGTVNVCQSSSLHVTSSNGSDGLLLALDRGALELHMKASKSDVLMTPDLRLTMLWSGPLDLRVRVARDGDTCVENRGKKAPVLTIQDQFGEGIYELSAGQHVLFEHGSLKEVVDRESTPCGCPPVDASGISFADAMLNGKTGAQRQVEREHPFPAAVSEGLAEPAPLPAETPGQTHVQIAGSLSYDGNSPPTIDGQNAGVAPVRSAEPEELPAPEKKGIFHAVGRFFKRIFGD